jgi:predicted  nucleic acid-binding Zn-ribbon protein
MPYHKNKQQAFQAAQQGTHQAKDIYENMEATGGDYGEQLKRLKNEVNEAKELISNALEVTSETQKDQLQQFQQDLENIVEDIDNKR